MTAFFTMLRTALFAMLVQNLIFSAAYGISESIRIAKRPKHFVMCLGSVTFFSTALCLAAHFVDSVEILKGLELRFRFLLYVLILVLLYLTSALVCVKLLGADKKFMNSLGMCAVNTLVIALPILNFKAGHTIFQAIGTGFGAGLAFALSVLLINSGMKFISKNKYIPPVFKGTPALIIYVSLLALTLSCISGETLFV